MIYNENPSPLQIFEADFLKEKNIKLYLKRDDLLAAVPNVSGNKYRKMKYNLVEMQHLGLKKMLTFGGAFSNHIHAAAAAGHQFGIETIGIVRGEKMTPLSTTLDFAEKMGMQLRFVSRTEYRDKEFIIKELEKEFSDFYFLPEGGTNSFAIRGCKEIVVETQAQLGFLPDYYCVASGTGGTVSGIIEATTNKQTTIGFSALKGDFLKNDVEKMLTDKTKNWEICSDYCCGGYAKFNTELIDFINEIYQNYQIPLDPIYTGKMLFGVFDRIKKGFFRPNTTIVVVHTGGLQGNEGFNQRFGNLLVC